MKVSATRRVTILKEMETSRRIHERGHYVVGERQLIDSIVEIIKNQRMIEIAEVDCPTRTANNLLIEMQG